MSSVLGTPAQSSAAQSGETLMLGSSRKELVAAGAELVLHYGWWHRRTPRSLPSGR